MHPSDQTIETAVLRIFRDYLIARENGHLSRQSLQQDWSRLHLRAEDLDAALQRLVQQGCLRDQPIDGQSHLVLLDKGVHRIGDLPHGALDFVRRSRIALELSLVDRRHSSAVSDGRERRAGDRDEPSRAL